MTTTMRVRMGRGWGAKRAATALAAIAFAAGGCHSGPHAARDASHPGATGSGGAGDAITIDGRFQDWPRSIATTADADWVYFKVTAPDLGAPLQAAPETLALWLDADGNGKTGARMATPKEASGLGVDAIVEFSPPSDKAGEGTKRGVVVYAADESGRTTPVPSAIAEVLVAPTHISDTYELRLSRHLDGAVSPALARILAGKGHAKAMYALIGRDGVLNGWSDPETFTMPAAGASPTLSDATVPAKADGTVRILSWNVLKSELMKNPGPFARVIQVANPDIILLQEWETDAATAQSWFTATVTGTHVWNARTLPGTDVVIVSAYPLTGVGPQSITTDTPPSAGGSEAEKARNVRFVAAMAQTPLGNVLVGTAHLKCCGTVGSPEDARRINEASAINAAMSVAFAQEKASVRVIAGDFNLVGSRAPIDLLRAGLDADGSELAVATTPVLGDRAVYTWSDPKTEFPDGRLDYALYSDATADLANAFVIDARRLSDRSLAKMGLDRGDTAASDHFPVVIDVRPRK